MNLAWMNNGFICKDLYAPFVLDKDTDYLDDLKKKYKTVGSYDRQYPYTETKYSDFDKFLFSSWKNKPNGKGKDQIPWGVPVD